MLKKLSDIFSSNTTKSLLFSLLSVMAFPYVFKILNPEAVSNSMVSVILWWCFYLAVKNVLNTVEKRLLISSFFAGILFSASLVFGKLFEMYGTQHIESFVMLKSLIVVFCFSFIVGAFIAKIADFLVNKKTLNCFRNEKIERFFAYDKNLFAKMQAVIIICWLPIWICLWPGVFEYDVYSEFQQIETGQYYNWHSLLHTFFTYGCMYFGRHFLGYDEAGCILYALIQVLIMSAMFSYVMCFLSKIKMPIWVQSLALMFFALHPINSTFAIATTKDIIFAGSFLILYTVFAEAVINTKDFNSSNKKYLLISFLSVIILLMRTNGIIILTLTVFALFGVLIYNTIKKGDKIFNSCLLKIMSAFLVPCFLYILLINIVYPKLNVMPTPPEEPISVPMQQVATVFKYHYDDIPDSEKDIFYSIFPSDVLKRYDSFCVDYLKFKQPDWYNRLINSQNYLNQKKQCKNIWVKYGLEYPKEYIKSFFVLNMPFWYTDYLYRMNRHGFNRYITYNTNDWSCYTYFVRPYFYDYYKNIDKYILCTDIEGIEKPAWEKSFLTGSLFFTGLPLWILLFGLFIINYCRKRKYLFPLIIPCILAVVYLFSPTYLLRYNYPLFLSFPIVLAMIELSVRNFTNSLEEPKFLQ